MGGAGARPLCTLVRRWHAAATVVWVGPGDQCARARVTWRAALQDDSESPLKERLERFGDLLTKIISYICLACWAVNIPNFRRKGEQITGHFASKGFKVAM